MEAAWGSAPLPKALRMPFSRALGCSGMLLSRALSAGGKESFSRPSVAGSPRQKRASSWLPATAATTAIRAAVLHTSTSCQDCALRQERAPQASRGGLCCWWKCLTVFSEDADTRYCRRDTMPKHALLWPGIQEAPAETLMSAGEKPIVIPTQEETHLPEAMASS